ncbi:hypothetical protein, partial [Aeromonas hydrophila]|uniref:hypothetical protein n=1 Tax=Aeromonas hydrophila TaxID=644 RepID=UPI00236093D9
LSDTQASIAANPDRLQEAAKAAEAITLDLPPGRGDALWQLIAGTAGASPELDAMRRGFRDLISGVWSVPVR